MAWKKRIVFYQAIFLMKKSYFTILALCSLTFQEPQQKEALKGMILAEKAFAQTSIDKNTQTAFLTFLAPEAVVFEKGMPINGLSKWKSIDYKGVLKWQPNWAGMAISADMGYSIGNWQAYPSKEATQASASGSFISLWKKQPTGDWRVLADIGVVYPSKPSDKLEERYSTFKPLDIKNLTTQTERFAFMKDHFYWKNTKTALNPFEPHLSEKVIIFRNNTQPLIGKTLSNTFLQKNFDKNLIYTGLKTLVSNAGDMACIYGTISGKNKAGKVVVGSYLRIWQQEAKDIWKIVVDVETTE